MRRMMKKARRVFHSCHRLVLQRVRRCPKVRLQLRRQVKRKGVWKLMRQRVAIRTGLRGCRPRCERVRRDGEQGRTTSVGDESNDEGPAHGVKVARNQIEPSEGMNGQSVSFTKGRCAVLYAPCIGLDSDMYSIHSYHLYAFMCTDLYSVRCTSVCMRAYVFRYMYFSFVRRRLNRIFVDPSGSSP